MQQTTHDTTIASGASLSAAFMTCATVTGARGIIYTVKEERK